MIRILVYKVLLIPAFLYKFIYRRRLRVLAYHDVVDSSEFIKHVSYLKSKYNLIDINTLREHLYNNSPLPKRSLLITFDDGDYTVFKNALPVLKKHECPACLFIITELINSNKDFWFTNIRKIEKEKGKSFTEVNSLMNHLKSISNRERLKELNKYDIGEKKQLNTSEVKKLNGNNIYIANHSHTHPMFNRCTGEEILVELNKSRTFFLQNNLAGYEVFAYPNGNFDLNSEKILKENGIEMAFLFDHNICSKDINPYRISRIRTNSDMSLDELRIKVSGFHSTLQKIKAKR